MTEARPSQPPEPKLRWQEAKIAAIMPDTPRVKSFLLAPSAPFPFRAGQHVDVRLTAPDGYQAERSYSIAFADLSLILRDGPSALLRMRSPPKGVARRKAQILWFRIRCRTRRAPLGAPHAVILRTAGPRFRHECPALLRL